jgi:hypothetical protein
MAINDNLIVLLDMNWDAKDSSWNNNHWTVNLATLTTDQLGNPNSAYNFVPLANHQIDLWNINIWTTDSSIVFWIRSNVSNYGSWGYYHMVYKKANTQMGFYLRNTGCFSYMMVWAVSYQYQITWVLDGLWHMIAVVKNSATWLIHYYRDWVSINTQAAVGSLDAYSDSFKYWISNTTFDGDLWMLRLYDRALSDSEIMKIYTATKGNHSLSSIWEYLTHSVSNIWPTEWLVWYYTLNWDWNDVTWIWVNSVPTWNISYWNDEYWDYAYFYWDANFTLWTWIRAGLAIWTIITLNQTIDFSYSVTCKAITLPPNQNSWMFWSPYQIWFAYNSAWTIYCTLRWSTIVQPNLWAIVLNEVHTYSCSYNSATLQFSVYKDWVLYWTYAWPTTFVVTWWLIWDNAIGWGNSSSSLKNIYDARVYNRILTADEHSQIAKVTLAQFSQKKGKTINNKFSSLWVDTAWLISLYNFNWNAKDSSGNNNHATVNWPTLTVDQFGNANSAYAFSGANQYITLPDTAIPLTFPITIECIAKPNEVPAGAINDTLVHVWTRATNQAYWLAFWGVTQWQKIMSYAWAQPNVYSDVTYTLWQVYHIVLTIATWGIASLYIDWVKQVSTVTWASLVPTGTLRELGRLWLNDGYALNGTIYWVSSFNRILSDAEIMMRYKATSWIMSLTKGVFNNKNLTII